MMVPDQILVSLSIVFVSITVAEQSRIELREAGAKVLRVKPAENSCVRAA